MPALAAADVLMTDLELPGLSGEQLALAARSRNPGMAVVFASGRSATTSLERCSMLRKPYDIDALNAALASQSA